MGCGDHTIGDEPGVVTRLRAVSYYDRLNVSDQAVWSVLGRAEETEVVDTVEGEESGHGGLVHLGSDGEE